MKQIVFLGIIGLLFSAPVAAQQTYATLTFEVYRTDNVEVCTRCNPSVGFTCSTDHQYDGNCKGIHRMYYCRYHYDALTQIRRDPEPTYYAHYHNNGNRQSCCNNGYYQTRGYYYSSQYMYSPRSYVGSRCRPPMRRRW